jgi:ribosomal protein L29
MKFAELKNKSRAELLKLLGGERESLRESAFGASGSQKVNVKARAATRKTVARILTVLKQQ